MRPVVKALPAPLRAARAAARSAGAGSDGRAGLLLPPADNATVMQPTAEPVAQARRLIDQDAPASAPRLPSLSHGAVAVLDAPAVVARLMQASAAAIMPSLR